MLSLLIVLCMQGRYVADLGLPRSCHSHCLIGEWDKNWQEVIEEVINVLETIPVLRCVV